jgi:hypothetical protein
MAIMNTPYLVYLDPVAHAGWNWNLLATLASSILVEVQMTLEVDEPHSSQIASSKVNQVHLALPPRLHPPIMILRRQSLSLRSKPKAARRISAVMFWSRIRSVPSIDFAYRTEALVLLIAHKNAIRLFRLADDRPSPLAGPSRYFTQQRASEQALYSLVDGREALALLSQYLGTGDKPGGATTQPVGR